MGVKSAPSEEEVAFPVIGEVDLKFDQKYIQQPPHPFIREISTCENVE